MFINSFDQVETADHVRVEPKKVTSPVELLIVDDEASARESLSEILKINGGEIATADNGKSAIAILRQKPVQIMLLDLNMPQQNGFEVLKYIDSHQLSTQVLIVSGEATFADARRALRYHFVYDFIKKPYEINHLIHSIENIQRLTKLEEENKKIQKKLNQSELMHRFFVDNSPDIFYLVDQSGFLTFLNPAIKKILGFAPDELIGKHYSCLIIDDDLIKAKSVFDAGSTEIKLNSPTELRMRCKSGEELNYVEVTAVTANSDAIDYLTDENHGAGHLPIVFGIIRNVNEHKLAQNELCKMHLAMDNSPNLIVITDRMGTIEYANRKLTETTGYVLDEVLGKNPRIFSSGETNDESYQDLWQTITSGQVWRGILKNQKKSGETYWARESIAPLINSEGVITSFIAIQEDVTETLLMTEKLSYHASHDSLTHLINRHEFDRRLDRLITLAQNSDTHHALCYIDLDQFKIVNDTCSHIAGDELLRQISTLIAQVIRRSDTLARLGGDEFAILMEYCPLDQAEIVTQKIHQIVEQFQFYWDDKAFRIGVSIGLVIIDFNKGGSDIHMKQADMACFMAKQAGRNRTHIYRDDDKALAQHHGEMNWVVRINKALEENLFCLYSQVIVALDVDEGEHCEILIRMKDRNGCIITPDAFLPAAERYQLSTKIDRWVIRNVFQYFTSHPERLSKLSMCSINLSGSSLTDPNFFSYIESQLIQTGMPSDKVCFEITETAAVANLSLASEFMNRLKNYGCKFSLDDFGSGLSSFAYLKNLPVDYLKIDGFFVKDVMHDSMDLAMVKSINDIGHILGKKTIAEFVENEAILETLNELKVDYAQGYYTGKPKPIHEYN